MKKRIGEIRDLIVHQISWSVQFEQKKTIKDAEDPEESKRKRRGGPPGSSRDRIGIANYLDGN